MDATITVDPEIGLAAGHAISDNVELRVTERYPNLDIVVHVEPDAPAADHMEIIRATAAEMKVSLHAVRIREIDGHLYINFHAEFPPEMTLAEAHRRVTELEEQIRERIPSVAEIESHLEPIGRRDPWGGRGGKHEEMKGRRPRRGRIWGGRAKCQGC